MPILKSQNRNSLNQGLPVLGLSKETWSSTNLTAFWNSVLLPIMASVSRTSIKPENVKKRKVNIGRCKKNYTFLGIWCGCSLQAFLDFRGFDFRNFWFTAVYNSVLFSSPLVLLSSLNLCGFCFRVSFLESPH